mmetsp:Transcript_2218/g.4986  ORF Transcript_2218/g.4986 Transcript_2218/m.4986 type:complete len:225 (+) Transcript_2218:2332-3006(+)
MTNSLPLNLKILTDPRFFLPSSALRLAPMAAYRPSADKETAKPAKSFSPSPISGLPSCKYALDSRKDAIGADVGLNISPALSVTSPVSFVGGVAGESSSSVRSFMIAFVELAGSIDPVVPATAATTAMTSVTSAIVFQSRVEKSGALLFLVGLVGDGAKSLLLSSKSSCNWPSESWCLYAYFANTSSFSSSSSRCCRCLMVLSIRPSSSSTKKLSSSSSSSSSE